MKAGALASLPGLSAEFEISDPNEGERRAALAKWLTRSENFLLRRSIVNRVWQFHFGRGLVDSPNDFGHMGAEPSHPELLDWLALWFMENGASLKALHKLIVRSATYQQSSPEDAERANVDGDNRFLWRMNRARLEAEAMRDTILLVSGQLDARMGGPSDQQFVFKDDHSPVYDYTRFDFAQRPDFGAASARAGNVIGGGDWAEDRIVPDCIRAIQGGVPITLRNPAATRPWQHVLEPLCGYLLLGTRLRERPADYAGAWNFGPAAGATRTVHDVAERIVNHMGRGRIELGNAAAAQHEARLLQLNCDKAHQLLGWQPRWEFDATLRATALWYKRILEGADAREVTRGQLQEYFTDAA